MKLCEHIQPIYEEEMRKGNTISSVTTPRNTCCYLCMHMSKKLSNHYEFSDIIPTIDRTPTYPVTIEYFCSKCGCRIDSPLDDKPSYPANTEQTDPMVLATPKNVYVKDNHFDQGMKPIILTEKQRLEIEAYWIAHSDEKRTLDEALNFWRHKREEICDKWWQVSIQTSEQIKKCQNRIAELKSEQSIVRLTQNKTNFIEQEQMEEKIACIKTQKAEAHAKLDDEIKTIEQTIKDISKKMVLGYGLNSSEQSV